jgi:dipeptidyl aminopeptidase/acylaminoacyl peptidase
VNRARTVPYGAWPSPISAAMLAKAAVGLGPVTVDGDAVWWLELRPREGGRLVLVRKPRHGEARDVTPQGYNVRTLVHEYGGGAFLVRDDVVWFSNFADQRLYRQHAGGAPHPVTPEPAWPRADRYADADPVPGGRLLYCVRERHAPGAEARNSIVAVAGAGDTEPFEVDAGHDFCASPRVSPDGARLAWVVWDHPNMPWDSTTLMVAEIAGDGSLRRAQAVMGGRAEESVIQPAWSPEGRLHALSDRSGWWNLYRLDDDGHWANLSPMEAEFGVPAWVFGLSTYAFLDDGRIACIVRERGLHRVALIEPDGTLTDPHLAWQAFRSSSLRTDGRTLVFTAASPTAPTSVVRWEPGAGSPDGEPQVLRRAFDIDLDPDLVSVGEPITYPTHDGDEAHALYYPPRNPAVRPPEHEHPPLIVQAHGGPTSETDVGLSLAVQYWTSRGFGFCDVNYRGSSGYGRAYRDKLKGQWGVVDIADVVDAARHLADTGRVDGDRLAVTGGSAGGFVVLAALAFHDVFAAGVSHYGVADLGLLAEETHKFESRYLDQLVGPWPEARAAYEQRSPLRHADGIAVPLLLLQGLEDEVVPPTQTQQMAAALAANRVPHAAIYFPGEQHGWRQATTIRRAVEAELAFYAQVFGFTPADEVEPVALS